MNDQQKHILKNWLISIAKYYNTTKNLYVSNEEFADNVVFLGDNFLNSNPNYNNRSKWQMVFCVSFSIINRYFCDDADEIPLSEFIWISDCIFDAKEFCSCMMKMCRFIFKMDKLPHFLTING